MVFKDLKDKERFYRYPENFTKGDFVSPEGTEYNAHSDSGTRMTFYDNVKVLPPKNKHGIKDNLMEKLINNGVTFVEYK